MVCAEDAYLRVEVDPYVFDVGLGHVPEFGMVFQKVDLWIVRSLVYESDEACVTPYVGFPVSAEIYKPLLAA